MLALPPELEAAIESALKTVAPSQWVSAARGLSDRYRAERTGEERPLARGNVAALGYAAMIMPAAYAQLRGAMAATAVRIPAWQPATLLDLGSGPGTALWAAAAQWPAITRMTAWERETAFIALGRDLASAATHPAVVATRWQSLTLGSAFPRGTPQYDLVVLGHVLNELDETMRQNVVDEAWAHTSGVLLMVEPGTSAAFPVVRAARDRLLGQGAHTIAPCAHDTPCPLENDWCHFPQRLARPAFQRRAKEGTANWEESKYSYAAMSRFPPSSPIWGRLIHQPQVNKAGVELIVSSREGIVRPRIQKRDRERFRQARDLHWGDALDAPPALPLE
jgi:ribosomal protein RSM22 (predicted rRNA methylase)